MEFKIKENANIGLHDCRTKKIEKDNRSITFYFPDGFYYIEQPEESPKMVSYDATMTCHLLEDDISVVVFRKTLFGKIVREDWSEKFISAVNAGNVEFEFVYTYRGFQTVLFKGYIWRKKKPWWRECELEFRTDEITYDWKNKLISSCININV